MAVGVGVNGPGDTGQSSAIVVEGYNAAHPYFRRPVNSVQHGIIEGVVRIDIDKIEGTIFELPDCLHAGSAHDGDVACGEITDGLLIEALMSSIGPWAVSSPRIYTCEMQVRVGVA